MQREIEHTRTERDILANVAAVDHPFLIKLHHSFQSTSQLFLVLDYYVGGDIATQLAKWHKFEAERCRLYAAEIILGMQELHKHGIVYRDLKPENILLSSDGHLVLTDFGLSKQFVPTNGEEKTNTFCGTAEYLAPEILRAEEYSYEVDYWSLGTLLYEMLTGITPFWAENHADMYRRVLEDDLEFPEDFDPVTADFIAGLLERDPEARLGAGVQGDNDIRSHPFFKDMSWDDVYNKAYTPPYVPDLHSETDFSNFDDTFLMMTPRLSPTPANMMLTNSIQDVFQGYSFTTHGLAGQNDESDMELNDCESDEDQQVPIATPKQSAIQSRYAQQLENDDDDMEEEDDEDYYYPQTRSAYNADFDDFDQEDDEEAEYEDDFEPPQKYAGQKRHNSGMADEDDSESEDEFAEQERKRSSKKKRHTPPTDDYAFDQQLSELLIVSQPARAQSSKAQASVVQMVPEFADDEDVELEFPVHQSMYPYGAAKKSVDAPARSGKPKSVLAY
ncbi:kinase-like domain-containing protein [Jimgerdemannia flammicorona]|uniref:Kinase-like domain-containing protein n=1 Tax=Jimgerdemannia flammicorona TaxID=994334 RepID=A0A433D7R0_9FUNG|nr:kinase-like domain-containing protein [Jimgerdemannia flammicorona]